MSLVGDLVRKVLSVHLTLRNKNRVILRIPVLLIVFVFVFFDPPMGFVLALALVAIASGFEFELEEKGKSTDEEPPMSWESKPQEPKPAPAMGVQEKYGTVEAEVVQKAISQEPLLKPVTPKEDEVHEIVIE